MKRFIKQPILSSRVPGNSNLTLYTGDDYKGLPILKSKGPFVLGYLERAYDTIERAIQHYPRLLAIRFDLRYPQVMNLPDEIMTNVAISRFVESIKAKIAHNREMSSREYARVHDTVVRYLWAKEYDHNALKPHYHFLLLLNRYAFHTLGHFNSGNENLRTRIISSWASALRMPENQCEGLVYFSKCHAINMNEEDSGLPELFQHVSYMCKVKTKRFGGGDHVFRCSSI